MGQILRGFLFDFFFELLYRLDLNRFLLVEYFFDSGLGNCPTSLINFFANFGKICNIVAKIKKMFCEDRCQICVVASVAIIKYF